MSRKSFGNGTPEVYLTHAEMISTSRRKEEEKAAALKVKVEDKVENSFPRQKNRIFQRKRLLEETRPSTAEPLMIEHLYELL